MARRFRLLALAVAGLSLCFALPLIQLCRFAANSGLYSYILLIPLIAVYLAWKDKAAWTPSPPAKTLAVGFGTAGAAALVAYWLWVFPRPDLAANDRLALPVAAYVFFLLGLCALILGKAAFRTSAFAFGFLLLMVPLPVSVENGLEAFLQHRSADAAYLLLRLFDTSLIREGLVFYLPGITLEVAPECSGIRSTLVLIICSLLAGHYFLRNGWFKALLVAAMLLLGIFRNALRIVIIGQLCIHISPTMVDSPLHHRGGPVFFVISLIPFLALLWYLRRLERKRN